MKLRPYQNECVPAVFQEWEEHTSTIIVLPTGTGKTTVFSEIIRRSLPKRSLVIAHREELIYQARDRIELICGVRCDIEMAEQRANIHALWRPPVVVATVQTLVRRLDTFKPEDFGVLVIDECHHGIANTYRKIIDHFRRNQQLKILGVTATPDRADEEAMSQLFDSVAYDYEILDAIHDGWLVPVEQQMVHIAGLDYSNVKTTAGDLNGGDLASIMEDEKNVQGIVGSTIDIIGDRSTILFASSVRHAEMAREIFNRHKPGMASFICGTTDKEERPKIMGAFRNGTTQVLCNVGIATEGVDLPNATVIVMGRPTKSRSLYAQMAGRALRPLAGLVDPIEDAEGRKAAIASSSKPAALLVDFVGNSGRHKLVSSADILGGNVSERAIEIATDQARKAGRAVDMTRLLDDAEKAEQERIEKERQQREAQRLAYEARKSNLVARVQYRSQTISPFDVLGLTPVKERGWDAGKVLSEKQRNLLVKQGINPDSVSYTDGKRLIGEIIKRFSTNECSFKQAALLKKHGYETNVSRKEASVLIDAIAKNHWRRPVAE